MQMEKLILYDGRTGEAFDNQSNCWIYVYLKTSSFS